MSDEYINLAVRAQEIIEDTHAYYAANPKQRRATLMDRGHSTCVYCLIDNSGRGNKMCAVGRLLIDPAAAADVEGGVGELAVQMGADCLDTLLVPNARGLPLWFWEELQRYHDAEENWTDDGESETGQAVRLMFSRMCGAVLPH